MEPQLESGCNYFKCILSFFTSIIEEKQNKNSKHLHVAALALAADVTTPKLVIDSIKPPYTILLRISYFIAPCCDGVGGGGGGGTRITCSPLVEFASLDGIS